MINVGKPVNLFLPEIRGKKIITENIFLLPWVGGHIGWL